jgi:hypothetical protein
MAAAEDGGVPETGRERQLSTALIRVDGLGRLDSFLGRRSARSGTGHKHVPECLHG